MTKVSEITSGKHPKQDFQVERIAFFSDAVFAIAITLLIIEFRPPHVTANSTYAEIWADLVHMKFKLGALVVSFSLIVNYWTKHHVLFKYIHNYNRHLVMANMWTLLPVIFFPFTTSFLYESLEGNEEVLVIPFRLFLVNNILAGATIYYFYHVITKKFKEVSYPIEKEDKRKFEYYLLGMIGSFLLVFLLSFISFKYSIAGLVPLALLNFYNKFIRKNKTIATKDDK